MSIATTGSSIPASFTARFPSRNGATGDRYSRCPLGALPSPREEPAVHENLVDRPGRPGDIGKAHHGGVAPTHADRRDRIGVYPEPPKPPLYGTAGSHGRCLPGLFQKPRKRPDLIPGEGQQDPPALADVLVFRGMLRPDLARLPRRRLLWERDTRPEHRQRDKNERHTPCATPPDSHRPYTPPSRIFLIPCPCSRSIARSLSPSRVRTTAPVSRGPWPPAPGPAFSLPPEMSQATGTRQPRRSTPAASESP